MLLLLSLVAAAFFLSGAVVGAPPAVRCESSHSLSYYWKDTRLTVYIWQPFEARIIETWRPNSETPGLHFKY